MLQLKLVKYLCSFELSKVPKDEARLINNCDLGGCWIEVFESECIINALLGFDKCPRIYQI